MPVRLLTSCVFKWPDVPTVDGAVRRWASKAANERKEVLCIGYFGSYARGDWGVGSDVDLVLILENSDKPFERRSLEWDTLSLPVPADLLVYTRKEWHELMGQRSFLQRLQQETVWVYISPHAGRLMQQW